MKFIYYSALIICALALIIGNAGADIIDFEDPNYSFPHGSATIISGFRFDPGFLNDHDPNAERYSWPRAEASAGGLSSGTAHLWSSSTSSHIGISQCFAIIGRDNPGIFFTMLDQVALHFSQVFATL